MRLLISLLFLSPIILFGQYKVLEAKKARKWDGEKVKEGDFLTKEDKLVISERGYLTLDTESAMHMKLAPGTYNVGDESLRHNKWYDTHLELTKELKRKGMIMCKFTYKTLVVPGSDRHYEIDRIELDQKPMVEIDSDTTALTVNWVNPDYKYKGGYHLVVRDYYNQGFIDVIEIEPESKSITFYPGSYGHRHMYYNIIADNCRASFKHKIQANSPGSFPSNATNFIESGN